MQSQDRLVSKQPPTPLPILSLLYFLKSRSFQSGVFADLGSAGSNPARDKTFLIFAYDGCPAVTSLGQEE